MDPQNHEELIGAYLDGELSDEQRERAEQLMASDANLRQLYEQWRELRTTLQSLPKHRLEEDFAARVLQRAERAMVTGEVVTESAPVADAAPTVSMDSKTKPGAASGPADKYVLQGRRWKRPLIWATLTIAGALLLLIFGPSDEQMVARHEADSLADNNVAEDNAAGETLADEAANAAPGTAAPAEKAKFARDAETRIDAADGAGAAMPAPALPGKNGPARRQGDARQLADDRDLFIQAQDFPFADAPEQSPVEAKKSLTQKRGQPARQNNELKRAAPQVAADKFAGDAAKSDRGAPAEPSDRETFRNEKGETQRSIAPKAKDLLAARDGIRGTEIVLTCTLSTGADPQALINLIRANNLGPPAVAAQEEDAPSALSLRKSESNADFALADALAKQGKIAGQDMPEIHVQGTQADYVKLLAELKKQPHLVVAEANARNRAAERKDGLIRGLQGDAQDGKPTESAAAQPAKPAAPPAELPAQLRRKLKDNADRARGALKTQPGKARFAAPADEAAAAPDAKPSLDRKKQDSGDAVKELRLVFHIIPETTPGAGATAVQKAKLAPAAAASEVDAATDAPRE